MYPYELIQSVRLITDVCLEIAPGENVLCITDAQEKMDVITLVAAECKARGAETAVILLEPRKEHHHEPPRSVALAMRDADVVIVMAYGELMHTKARKAACAAGVKYAAIGGLTKEYLVKVNLSREDLIEVRALSERIAERLTAASTARLTSRAGTDLSMSLEGRKGGVLLPFGVKGSFCMVPVYAETFIAPIEDSVEGVAVIDGTVLGAANFEGLVEEPFEIQFKKGQVVRVSGGKDAKKLQTLLDGLEDAARTFAELGVNSNPKIPQQLLGMRMDNSVAGHVHIGLGRNDHIGGKSATEAHLDLLLTWPILLLDGKPIVENGKLLI
jgi:leucyl aminopeptidase (aminopeptidase T)